MSLPISVFIIAKNEEDRISHAIKSVIGWADEVIVIDSGSTDNTVGVAKNLGASVVFNQWQGYGRQKIFGEKLCRNEWVLNIDADEEVSGALAQELQNLVKEGNPPYQAYGVKVKIIMRNCQMASRFAPCTDTVRFYNKNHAGFRDSTVHDSVILKDGSPEKYGLLKGEVYHRCFRSLHHAVEKINFYTDMQALDMQARGKYPSNLRIIFEPLFAFAKAYLIRRYFLYGIEGFIESIIYAFNRTLRLAKARELVQVKKISNR
jgi:glycosyltransferase involved in cell wall biosynthesis